MFDYCNLPWRPSPISTPILPLGRLLSLLSYATVERLINNSFCASFKNYQFHQWLLYTVRAAISSTLSFLKGGNNNTFVSGLEQSWLVERNLATDHLTLVHLVLSIGPKPSPSDVSFLPVQSKRVGTCRDGGDLPDALLWFSLQNSVKACDLVCKKMELAIGTDLWRWLLIYVNYVNMLLFFLDSGGFS